ncbi:MAG: DUF4962 domain-containing protein, partial [Planctomycetota bacterium]
MIRHHWLSMVILASLATAVTAADFAPVPDPVNGFADEAALDGWQLSGDAAIDTDRNHPSGEGAALRIGPGAKAVARFRDANDSGLVEFWVYDDMTVPDDPEKRRVGPRWGLLQADGRVFVVGSLYAPYLAGKNNYVAVGSDGKQFFTPVMAHLSPARRSEGWHRWTFRMDPDEGLILSFDGRDVNAGHRTVIDWDKTQLTGFVGVVFYGDSETGKAQTIWVDALRVDLGGPMAASPTPPPPPPPAVPDSDPAVDNPARLRPEVADVHPRLLFGPEDIPLLRAKAEGPGRMWYDMVLKYLGASKPPEDTKYLRDATDAQRQFFWRLPTVALHYVITGDEQSFERAKGFLEILLNLDHWEEGKERDSGMGAGNVLAGAALAFDWLYNDLDPDFREAFRRKLLLQARRMYHIGHLKKGPSRVYYWQGDPQNNHRWHRDAGLLLATLAAYSGDPSEDWILTKAYEEAAFVATWLPDDGTCHESSSYMIFGGPYLTLALQSADRCFGTSYLDLPYFKNHAPFRLQVMTPGLRNVFDYGDSGGTGSYGNYLLKCAALNRQADVRAALLRMHELNWKSFMFGWFSVIWDDPTLTGGSVDDLPTTAFYDDLGMAFIRDGWTSDDVGVMFKCGPYGGYKLNEYRNQGDSFRGVNVAHNDPDANSFLIAVDGALVAETSGYSKKKVTSSHNTLLVGGMGQKNEGGVWVQPWRGDMSKMAVVTTWLDAGDVVVVEGEAAGAYPAGTSRRRGKARTPRPALDRYRRTFVWVKGDYLLVLDDIRAEAETELTWLMQGPDLDELDPDAGRYQLRRDEATCPFQVAADNPWDATIVTSTADQRGKPLGWKQVQLSATTDAWRLA